MDLQLKDRVIIVTGGAKGIGLGIVQTLAAEGAIPFIIGRSGQDNQKAAGEIQDSGGKCLHVEAELSSPEACREAVERIVAVTGRIDGLVNNAGLNDGIGLENGGYDEFMLSLHRTLVHYYVVTHHALAELIRSKGAILNITSKTAETGQGKYIGVCSGQRR